MFLVSSKLDKDTRNQVFMQERKTLRNSIVRSIEELGEILNWGRKGKLLKQGNLSNTGSSQIRNVNVRKYLFLTKSQTNSIFSVEMI